MLARTLRLALPALVLPAFALACSTTQTATPLPVATMATETVATPQPVDGTEPETVFVTAVPTATAVAGTRQQPTPPGESSALGDGWTLRVVGVTPDASEAVLAQNQFNEPPETGEQFFIVRVAMTFNGRGSADVAAGTRLRLVGDSAVAYTTYNDGCGVVPDELPDTEVFTGGTVEGNLCWSVKSSDVGSLVLFDDAYEIADEDRKFFSLAGDGDATPTAGPTDAPAVTPTPGITETPSAATGTLADPIPLGEPAVLDGPWLVRVVEVQPDATKAVLAENKFNDRPPQGQQFYLVTLSASYLGQSSGTVNALYRFRGVVDGNVVYTTFKNRCGVIPTPLPDGEVFAGGTITGNVCWAVKSKDAASIMLIDEPDTAGGRNVYFALK